MSELYLIRASAITSAMHLAFGVVALFIGALAIWAIDYFLLKKIDLEEEIARGNIAAAVYASALWIALAMILAFARLARRRFQRSVLSIFTVGPRFSSWR